jgi:hypothetical protein
MKTGIGKILKTNPEDVKPFPIVIHFVDKDGKQQTMNGMSNSQKMLIDMIIENGGYFTASAPVELDSTK